MNRGGTSQHAHSRLTCAGCGRRIGVYEVILRAFAEGRVERTSWLRLAADRGERTGDALWHETCGRAVGLVAPET